METWWWQHCAIGHCALSGRDGEIIYLAQSTISAKYREVLKENSLRSAHNIKLKGRCTMSDPAIKHLQTILKISVHRLFNM